MPAPTEFTLRIPDPYLPPLEVRLRRPLRDEDRERMAGDYAARRPRHLRERAFRAALRSLAQIDVTPEGHPITRSVGHDPDDVPLPPGR
jgi:hypothetical protein